jgi:hypothetical protein
MSDASRVSVRWWRGRRLRLLFIVGLLVMLLAWVSVDVWAGRQIDAEYARLEKKFGSLEGRWIHAPAVPDDDNRARPVRAASLLIIQPEHTSIGALLASLARYERLPPSSPLPDDLRTFVAANEEAIRIAGEARGRHQSSWDADYGGGSNVPSLLSIRTLGNAVYVAALGDLQAGRDDAAASHLATGLAVGASFRQEPILIGQLIRIVVSVQQCEGIKRLITEGQPSGAALQDLAYWLAENRSPDPIQIGLLAELRQGNHTLQTMENGQVTRVAHFPRSSAWLDLLARLGRPFIRLARLDFLREMDRLTAVAAGPRPRPPFVAAPLPRPWNPRLLSEQFTAGLGRSMETGDSFTSVRGTTQLGVALRRYRLDHGIYPDALSALVPTYLPWVPDDPMTGRPPAYARSGGGFTLKAQPVGRYPPHPNEWAVPK